jgi:hypothetical protein
MSYQDWAAIAIVALAAGSLAWRMWRGWDRVADGCGGCSGCPPENKKTRRLIEIRPPRQMSSGEN